MLRCRELVCSDRMVALVAVWRGVERKEMTMMIKKMMDISSFIGIRMIKERLRLRTLSVLSLRLLLLLN